MPASVQSDMATINEALGKLRSNYIAQMIDRILLIENASVRISEDVENEEAWYCIQKECHKLAGISKTLGFDKIGSLAKEIDGAIETTRPSWAILGPKVDDLLDKMERELD